MHKEYIDPPLAESYLARTTRKTNDKTVARLERALAKGREKECVITFRENGSIIGGQNILKAIINTGVSVRATIKTVETPKPPCARKLIRGNPTEATLNKPDTKVDIMETSTQPYTKAILESLTVAFKAAMKEEIRAIYKQVHAEAMKEKESTRMMTASEVAEELHVSRTTLSRWAKADYLKPVYVGGKKMYRVQDVEGLKR